MLLLAALALAVVDWWSVFADQPRIEAVAKPAVMVVLVAALVNGGAGASSWMIGLGLLLSLLGDVLLLPKLDRFTLGLGSFLLAHIAFIVAFSLALPAVSSRSLAAIALGLGLSLSLWLTLGRRTIASSRAKDSALGLAVSAYVLALSLMVVIGVGVGSAVLATGTLFFALSDGILGWNRFVDALPHGRLATHVLYHCGQGLIVLWAIDTI